jgi:hypothetical protein
MSQSSRIDRLLVSNYCLFGLMSCNEGLLPGRMASAASVAGLGYAGSAGCDRSQRNSRTPKSAARKPTRS